MEYDFGWADLLATYSHTESRTVNAVPYTAYSIGWPTSAIYDSDHEEDSTEVRIATKFDGPWNFVAGLYAEDLKDEVIPPSDLAMQYVWTGDPATNFFNPGQLSVGGLYEKRDLEQKAAFGEVSWEFVPGLTLTGGVRLHDYERTTHFEQAGIFGSGSDDVAADESGNTFRGNLSYKFNENSLVYGGWSQGFRLGKPQSGLPASLCDINGDGIVDGTTNVTIESTKRINSDEVDNYELGGKFSLLDRRVIMEAAIFRIDWEGIPITTNAPLPPDGCALGYTANAGTARSEGIEFQASFLVTDAFRIDAGGSFIEAEFTEDAPSVNAVAGTRLPGSPKENANLSLQYQFEIGDRAAYIRADSIYVGPFYTVLGLGEVPSNRAGDYLKLDLSARVMFEKFDIDLFVRNVTDEDAFTLRDPFFPSTEFYGYRLRPRTVGMKVSVRF
jgi:outer membrane receptor protein involved in Fe transport